MKVLLDQNISYKLIKNVPDLCSEFHHVILNGWKDFSDHHLFKIARENNYDAVITLDDDFIKTIP